MTCWPLEGQDLPAPEIVEPARKPQAFLLRVGLQARGFQETCGVACPVGTQPCLLPGTVMGILNTGTSLPGALLKGPRADFPLCDSVFFSEKTGLNIVPSP